MRLTTTFAALAYAVTALAQGQLLLNTPNGVTTCLRTLLTWSGGEAPYTLTVNPGGQPSAPALEELGRQTGTSFSWLVRFPAGTSLFLRLRDDTGAISETASFTVLAGTETDCADDSVSVPSASSTPPGSSDTPAPPPPSGGSSTPTGGNGPTTGGGGGSNTRSSTGSAPAETSSEAPSSAQSLKVGGSVAAVAGAVALAVLA